MPVFTLTKYNADKEPVEQPETQAQDGSPESKEAEEFITVSASEPIAKVVAQALHKRMQNVKEHDGTDADTAVITTEEINLNPVHSYNRANKAKQVVILNKGFKTKKEEWLLSALQAQAKPVFYSIESFLDSLVGKGVTVWKSLKH